MKVRLSVVGMYYGTTVDIASANPSVADILFAAKNQALGPDDPIFGYTLKEPSLGIDERFIDSITVEHRRPATSRKRRENGQPNQYSSGVYSYSDMLTPAEIRERVQRGQPILVWQYYIFDAPAVAGGDLGDSISDDGIIVPVDKSNTKYQIKDGGAVVIRLIALFGGPTGPSFRTEVQAGYVSAKQLLNSLQIE